MANDPGFKQFNKHFPQKVSKKIVDYVNNVVLLGSRYIFTNRMKGIQQGYCTHCNKSFITNGKLKHGKPSKCPKCKSECIVKASGISRKYMKDSAFFVYYERSRVNPLAITARGISVERDYTGDYQNVTTKFRVDHMILFEPGKTEMYEHYWNSWKLKKNIISPFAAVWDRKYCFVSENSIKSAVTGTPFQYSTWEEYSGARGTLGDMVKFFELYAKYPCVEYLTKLGMSAIIRTKLEGGKTYGAINWRGKTLEKVLRLSKQEAKEWVKQPFRGGVGTLYAYQYFRKNGLGMSFEQASKIHELANSYYQKELNRVLGFVDTATFSDAVKYLLKQMERKEASKHYWSSAIVLGDWRDYIRECQELGMDLTKRHVLYPNDLHSAHQKTLKKVRFKRNEELNRKIKERANELEKYCFQHRGLIIRPARSNEELFEEGKKLIHCVGGYAKDYAEGRTNIFVIRKLTAPDKPFFTLEFFGNKVIQCRGYENCNMTPEVEKAVDKFESELKKTKNRVKVGVAV